MKKISGFIIFLFLISCNIGKRDQVEQVIRSFENNNVPDKREVIFNVETVYNNGEIVLHGETSNPELKKQLVAELTDFDFNDEITLLPDTTVGEKPFALVNVSVANLRASKSHASEIVTQAILGTPVKILKKEEGWYFIQTPDNYISWVDEAGIFPVSELEFIAWKNSNRVICLLENDLIFQTNLLENQVSDVTLGSILQNIEEGWNWIKVQFPDGRTGFVKKNNWSDFKDFKETVQPIPEQLIVQAKRLIGRSYLWGGTSAYGMDCSGFVKTVYFMNGIILARDASLQTNHGNLIEVDSTYNNLEPGDLLFFGSKASNKNKERVTHVALSFGNTEYIHASGWIKQNSFDSASKIYSEHRKKTFVRARRIIGSTSSGIQQLKEHPWY